MALSKPTFLTHLKTLAQSPLRHHRHHLRRSPPPQFLRLRCLSFATPEDAAAERRRRKRRLRIEPPINRPQTQFPPKPISNPNPNSPKLPEPISALAGNRLNLHNRILALIRDNDLDEAALFTRHSVYSNCRPTVFTVNAVLNAQLRQGKYSDLLALHRFAVQAGIAPNVITYNLILQTYLDCRKPDTAMEHYRVMVNDAPFGPSPTSYRILIKGLVDNDRLDRALEVKEEMLAGNVGADPVAYHYLMVGCLKNSDGDSVFKLYDELKERLGGVVDDGVVCGSLMRAYFLKSMEEEAMQCYREAVGEDLDSNVKKMSAVAYNSVLDALSKNDKFDEVMILFERMIKEHDPPMRLALNLGSFNVMVDGYCARGRFSEAIAVFRRAGDYRCNPDATSFNNLIEQLCDNEMLGEAEELYGEMGDKGVNPDEFTYALLVDSCFRVNKPDDAAEYFRKMVESGLRPNLAFYNKFVDQLVKAGNVETAKVFFDLMVKKLKFDVESYTFMMKTLSDDGKLDEMLKVVDTMLDDDGVEFDSEVQEFIKNELAKEGREEELAKLVEEKERLKAEAKAKEAEAVEASKRGAKLAIASLLPSKLFGNKEDGAEAVDSEGNGDAPADGAHQLQKPE